MATSPHVKAALEPLKDQLIAAGASVVEADPELNDIVSVQRKPSVKHGNPNL